VVSRKVNYDYVGEGADVPSHEVDSISDGGKAHAALPNSGLASFFIGDIERLRLRGSRSSFRRQNTVYVRRARLVGEGGGINLTTPTPGFLLTETRYPV
jgi:hypothetical protein